MQSKRTPGPSAVETGEGIVVLEADGSPSFVSATAARMFGYAPQEMLAMPLEAFLPSPAALSAWLRDPPPADGHAGWIVSHAIGRGKDGSNFPATFSAVLQAGKPIVGVIETRGPAARAVAANVRRVADEKSAWRDAVTTRTSVEIVERITVLQMQLEMLRRHPEDKAGERLDALQGLANDLSRLASTLVEARLATAQSPPSVETIPSMLRP